MNFRKIEEKIFVTLMLFSVAGVLAVLVTIVVMVCLKGLPSLTLSMITQTPKGGYYLGKEGGILNAIVGSLYLAGGATLLAFVFSLPVALFLQKEYSGGNRYSAVIRLSLDILWGIPSIVYGAFGFIVMLYFGIRASLFGGIIVLTLLEIPVMARAMDEVVRSVPVSLKEASDSIGATRWETSVGVVIRQALPGILTAILLAFGRGIGDAASVLFTAGYSDRIPSSLSDPVASLPLAIFFQLGTPFAEVRERAYASALILLIIVLLISIVSRLLSKKLTRYIIK